jgi:hypothetical protein
MMMVFVTRPRAPLSPLRGVGKFLTLPRVERRLFVDALVTLVFLLVSVRLASTRWVFRRVLARDRTPTRTGGIVPEDVGLAVTRASRLVPGATCLPQALTVVWLLRARGHRASMRIGVKRGETGKLIAHAWVECGGRIIIGGPSVQGYRVLPSLDVALGKAWRTA